MQGHFAFEALEALGPVVGFTAWCSAEISAKAYASGNPLPWLRKRIADALSKIGGVEFIAVLEEEWSSAKGTYRLHLHGILGIDGSKRRLLAKVRKALRRAMGSWNGEARKHQIRFSHDLDCGWASYCTKRTWLALPGIRRLFASAPMHSSFRLSFDGPVMTMTNGVRELAKELHQEARRAVQEARKRPIAVELPQTTPEAAAPVSESLDAPARATRFRSRPTKMPMTPLPIPIVTIVGTPIITISEIWKASIGNSLPTTSRSSWPMPARAPRPVLAVQVMPIATGDRLPADARSRGPPGSSWSRHA
ncbi:hypothetical protein [Methylobacterium frigidaeris]|uniref:Uncharacterized protein n=1 Tax=Methylobacterium frigidaeris TaxID=2038277 RepID=A0AA37HBE3_9HYPH|nr:hypothetical protein [Methylobacterium frigidaeris]GJD62130.1 hypothetical protein MPEAHAMD_2279 [Methylobacterium frigidaeris]